MVTYAINEHVIAVNDAVKDRLLPEGEVTAGSAQVDASVSFLRQRDRQRKATES